MTGEAQPDGSDAADDEGRREIEWQLSAPDLETRPEMAQRPRFR